MVDAQGKYTQHLLGLPILEDIGDLSEAIRFPKEVLSKYRFNNDKYYHKIEVKKKPTGIRNIESPTKELKSIQKWVLKNVLDKLHPSIYAKGFVKRRSIKDNAIPHEGHQYVLNIDLKDFFTTINALQVYTLFKSIGYNKNISFLLASICTKSGYLPQGAPTSPAISNLVCLRLDRRISSYCDKKALAYTRYADDISISGNKVSIIKKASYLIKEIIIDEGFVLNDKKEKLLGPRLRREVTGLTITPRITIGKKQYSIYRKRLHDLSKMSDNLDKGFYPQAISQGIISFVKSIDSAKGEKLHAYYEKERASSTQVAA
ncbi:retron St85 family RNA-directed DNA polymerase [Plesiomonas shigelloides]|uniref:retron St85 family RNA-directed DNA polymerase n=1 Tax=Plesiomonas shigelloides TaxID=703 RepID=UPI00387EF4AA